MAKNKSEILADLIKEKSAAGLTPVQARECAERQIAHDEQLEAADAKPASKAEGPKK